MYKSSMSGRGRRSSGRRSSNSGGGGGGSQPAPLAPLDPAGGGGPPAALAPLDPGGAIVPSPGAAAVHRLTAGLPTEHLDFAAARERTQFQRLTAIFSSGVLRPLMQGAGFLVGSVAGFQGPRGLGLAGSLHDQLHAWLTRPPAERSALTMLCDAAKGGNHEYAALVAFQATRADTLLRGGVDPRLVQFDVMTFKFQNTALLDLAVALVQYLEYYARSTTTAVSGQRGIGGPAMDNLAAEVLRTLMVWLHVNKLHGVAKGKTIEATSGVRVGRNGTPAARGLALMRAQSVVTAGGRPVPELNDADTQVLWTVIDTLRGTAHQGLLDYFLVTIGRPDFGALQMRDLLNPPEWDPNRQAAGGGGGAGGPPREVVALQEYLAHLEADIDRVLPKKITGLHGIRHLLGRDTRVLYSSTHVARAELRAMTEEGTHASNRSSGSNTSGGTVNSGGDPFDPRGYTGPLLGGPAGGRGAPTELRPSQRLTQKRRRTNSLRVSSSEKSSNTLPYAKSRRLEEKLDEEETSSNRRRRSRKRQGGGRRRSQRRFRQR